MASSEDTISGAWEEITIEGEKPTPRYGVAAAVVQGVVYTFGGCTNEEESNVYHNDFHKLTVSNNTLQWEKIEPAGEVPPGREGHGLLAVGKTLYIVGGSTLADDSKFSPDIYAYDVERNSCEKVEYDGVAPMHLNPIYCVIGPSIYVFGGIHDGEVTNELHIFDTASKRWSFIATSGSPPHARCDHAAAVVDQKMYIFGGSGGEELSFSDMWWLDTSDCTWHLLSASSEDVSPGQRDFSSLVPYGKKGLVLFGGEHGDTPYNSTFYLDFESGKWSNVQTSGDEQKPTPRFSHTAVMLQSHKMVIFAGMNDEKDFDSSHMLTLPELEGDFADESFEPTSLPPTRYEMGVPVPARRRPAPHAPKTLIHPRDFEERKQTLVKYVTDAFDELTERFLKLDQEREAFRVEKAAFEEERRNYLELFEKQQKELKEMFEHHRAQNDEWLQARREENDKERQFVANEKARWERAHAKLEEERTVFDQKNKKMEAIMKQFQGLG